MYVAILAGVRLYEAGATGIEALGDDCGGRREERYAA